MQGISHLRVLDLSQGIAGAYCTKLFADAGADVIKMEPPEGDFMRRHTSAPIQLEEGEDGALFKFLASAKRSITADTWPPAASDLNDMAADADLLVESFTPGEFDPEPLMRDHPHLVVLSITPFGRTGPWAEHSASELVLQAASGALAMRGLPEYEPFCAGGKITEWTGGTYAAVAALAACLGAQQTGEGEHIDLSLCEVANNIMSNFTDIIYSMSGKPTITEPSRSLEIPEIYQTKDGYIGFTTNTRQQFEDFLVLIERPEWFEDEELKSFAGRRKRRKEFSEAVNEWTSKFTSEEIMERSVPLRIPTAPVANGKTALENPHFSARNIFKSYSKGEFMAPCSPFRLHIQNGEGSFEVQNVSEHVCHPEGGRFRPAPTLGEHNGKIEPRNRAASASGSSGSKKLPMEGILIADFTGWWAGPSAAHILGSMGASVIHIESTRRPDGIRMTGGMFGDKPDWWERSPFFLQTNTSKRDLAINLQTPEGMEAITRLLVKADLVIENFTPRVMEQFGLDFGGMAKINPKAVVVRMPAFGLDGPWRDLPGFAQTMEQAGGMAWMTGHDWDNPHNQRGPSDPNAGMHAAFCALLGLAESGRTQKGCFLETPMIEGALNASAEMFVTYTAYGHLMERNGNRSAYGAPQNIYACKIPKDKTPAESWVAMSVVSQEQWEGLKRVLGNPEWMNQPSVGTHRDRLNQADFIDENLAPWFADNLASEAVGALQKESVPAAEVTDPRLTNNNEQFQARGYFEEVAHPIVGTHKIASLPFRFKGVDSWVRSPAPTLGQHNHEVLQELGYGEAEIQEMEEKGIIGIRPDGT